MIGAIVIGGTLALLLAIAIICPDDKNDKEIEQRIGNLIDIIDEIKDEK